MLEEKNKKSKKKKGKTSKKDKESSEADANNNDNVLKDAGKLMDEDEVMNAKKDDGCIGVVLRVLARMCDGQHAGLQVTCSIN